MSEAEPHVRVEKLVKIYGNRTVLHGVDLTINRAETLVIIGGSGAGKSTLVRHLIALERPTSGNIIIDGTDISSLSEVALARERRRFGMVFQKYALFDSMTCFDNVAFPLREQTKLSERDIREKAMQKLKELSVDHAANLTPAQISGGMAKRVGIARALVMEPELLIYDEPTSGLDPVTSRTVDDLIEEMREKFGVTSAVITHDMVSAFDIADQIAMLIKGRVVAQGTPAEVLDHADPSVQSFIRSSGVDASRFAQRRPRSPSEALAEKAIARKRARVADAK
ncbi:MAG: ABC transporter ATP-binding protein [Myxococcales bacterium]|nr:ABC transporter ATP-binding protein [Myxococcales bacterium]